MNKPNSNKMKATQLSAKQVEKIIYALQLTFGDESNIDKSALKLAQQLAKAKAVITAK